MHTTRTTHLILGGSMVASAVLAIALITAPASAKRSCTPGKEQTGCKIKTGGFYKRKDPSLIAVFPNTKINGKKVGTQLGIPGTLLCGDAGINYSLTGTAAKVGKVGSSVKLNSATAAGRGAIGLKASIKVKLKITSAKKAQLTGSASIDLGTGAKCAKSRISEKLIRATGG